MSDHFLLSPALRPGPRARASRASRATPGRWPLARRTPASRPFRGPFFSGFSDEIYVFFWENIMKPWDFSMEKKNMGYSTYRELYIYISWIYHGYIMDISWTYHIYIYIIYMYGYSRDIFRMFGEASVVVCFL